MISAPVVRSALVLVLLPLFALGQSAPDDNPPQPSAGNANERILQIRRLGKTDSRSIPLLAQNLSDPNRDIRAEAVRAIVKIGTEHSLDALVTATRDSDSDIDMLATDGIVNFYLPGYVSNGVLSHPLSRGVGKVKSFFSVRNRQAIAPDITIRPTVGQALADEIQHASSVDARANAARAAGILRDGAAVPALESALRSRETELMLECMYSLQKIADPAAGPSVSFLLHDLDTRVQMAALETVGLLRCIPSAPDVRTVFSNASNEKVRRAALQTLALFGLPDDRALFQQYASEKDVTLRTAAIEGLGRIRAPEDYPLLEGAYNEKNVDWRVRLAAAFGMVEEGKVDTAEFSPLPYLVNNLGQTKSDDTAQAYLTELCRRPDVRKAVYALLPQASSAQKIALCTILGQSGADDAVPVLNGLQNNMDSDVSLAAARGLRILQARRP